MADPRYPIRDTFTGKVKHVPLSAYQDFLRLRVPGSSAYAYEPMSGVPGTRQRTNGELEQVVIPKEQAREATFEGSSYKIWGGAMDPSWDVARRDMAEEGRRKTDRDRSSTAVLYDAMASQLSLGLYSATANYLAGDEWMEQGGYAAQSRERSIQEHPFAHVTGRAAGLLIQGMLPIPGLSTLTKAFGIANVGTAFELGAASSTAARSLFAGKTFGSALMQRMAGTMAFGATAEIPLSVALASADLVDHNKPYTGEALASAATQQYLWANAITAVWALPLSTAVTAFQSAGRFAVSQASQPITGGLMDSMVRGPARFLTRRYLRGKYHGAGDIAEVQVGKEVGKFVRAAQRNQMETPLGRLIMGDEGVSFIRKQRTVGEAIEGIQAANTTQSFKEALHVIDHNLHNAPELSEQVARLQRSATQVVNARRVANEIIDQGDKWADDALKIKYRLRKKPKGAPAMLLSKVDVHDALAGPYAAAAKKLPVGHPAIETLLAKAAVRKGSYVAALDDAMNLRMQVPKGPARSHISDGIIRATNPENHDVLKAMFNQMDEVERAATSIKAMAPQMRERTGVGVQEGLEQYRANIKSIEGNFRKMINKKVNAIRDPEAMTETWFVPGPKQPYFKMNTKIDDVKGDFELLGEANDLWKRLREDARPVFAASRPMTQDEILAAQIETVISTKRRTVEAFKYILGKGGGIRHTLAYMGVMSFRSMGSLEDKRTAFAIHRDAVLAAAGNPEALQEQVGQVVGPLAIQDMELGANMANTLATGNLYLLQQMPRSDDPMIGPSDFSGAEIENWLEAVGAVTDPISVLYTAKDGSTTSQAVDALRAVYPELYMDMVLDVAEFVHEWGHKLGDAQMHGLDTFTGGALHYTDAPGPFLSYQLPGYQTTQQAASAGAIGGPEHRRMNYRQNATAAEKVGGL